MARSGASYHAGAIGTIYLFHFDAPFGHARHYIGWTTDLAAREKCHVEGNGSKFLAKVRAAGITWSLVRTWEGTRHRERRLKRNSGPRHCPVCRAERKMKYGK